MARFSGPLPLSLLLLLVLALHVDVGNAIKVINGTCGKVTVCRDGIMFPRWEPDLDIGMGDRLARASVYFIALAFMFLGVSIISDRFMSSIEVITSSEREVVIKKSDGETAVVTVRIWNETVSNLTLMALGSSAPEIMLSVIEIIGNGFEAGDLGPSTIVGSAAFNLFMIVGYCCYVIPDGEVRKIKHLSVFFVTATWSIFAYLWMYVIIAVSSYGTIEVWEGTLTFIFFPVTVIMAYIADRHIFFFSFLKRKYSPQGIKDADDMEMGGTPENKFKGLDSENAEVREFERHRRDFMEILRELRKKYPNMDMKTLEEKAEFEAMNKGPKSRAFYRIQATRKLTGGGQVVKKAPGKKVVEDDFHIDLPEEEDNITRIYFEPGHYTVMENVGSFSCTVARSGGNLNNTVYVDYRTEDGTANAGSDYDLAEGTLVFQPGEIHKSFSIVVIDDDVFEEDEHFYVSLSNIRAGDHSGMFSESQTAQVAQLANPSMATVMILDDDHGGIFHFESNETTFAESVGEAQIKVCRSSGARGKVAVPYRTSDGSAKEGRDYEPVEGELIYDNDEVEGYIKVVIKDFEEYERNDVFYVEIGEPLHVKTDEEGAHHLLSPEEEAISQLGKPRLGDFAKLAVHIRESMEFKSTVDKLLKRGQTKLVVGTSSWREQFIDALTVQAGEDDDGEGGDDDGEGGDEVADGGGGVAESMPSCMDYVMHFLTLFWKVLFAFVPPTDYLGGWVCFTVSISMIGLLTAVIGDIASHFGCTIGLKDSVTAISFVALGTSLPDTFASKVAAINDDCADSSVGNVTGSNAVNVFLGIGIAWTLAAIKHAIYGTTFNVQPGSLAFSVTIFCIMAFMAIVLLVFRRRPAIGGELGGPRKPKILTTSIMVSFWVLYVLLSSFEAYCYIDGF